MVARNKEGHWTGFGGDVPAAAAWALHPPALLRALRPLQWTKNGLVFAALAFDQRLFEPNPLLRTVVAALVFCAVSSAVYLVNDLRDVERDRLHPKQRRRPIAAGEVTARQAAVTAAALVAGAVGASLLVRPEFAAVVVGYLGLMLAYTYGLKHAMMLDVFAIAAGFVLRAAGGAVAIAVPISPWLYVCSALLALFLGFAKRRHELSTLEANAARHRPNLAAYSVPLLDQIIGIVASATVMAYAFYTFGADNVPENHAMMLTIPFVVYAIFRYLFLIQRRNLGGSPEVVLVTDRPLLACIGAWGLTSVLILYLAS